VVFESQLLLYPVTLGGQPFGFRRPFLFLNFPITISALAMAGLKLLMFQLLNGLQKRAEFYLSNSALSLPKICYALV
jgi:hypothetical protein